VLAPIVNGLMKNYTDRARLVRVNILDPATRALQTEFGFSATPEFYLLDPQGKVVYFWDDGIDLADLEAKLQAIQP
jgi:hypothetical protein